MRKALFSAAAGVSLAIAMAAPPAGARAACHWTGYQWVCPMLPGHYGSGSAYSPQNEYGASRNWGGKYTGFPPRWDPSYPGPRPGGGTD